MYQSLVFLLAWMAVSPVATADTPVASEDLEVFLSGLNLTHAGTLNFRFPDGKWRTISVFEYSEHIRRFTDQTCREILHFEGGVIGLAFSSSFGRGEGTELSDATWVNHGGKTYLQVVPRGRHFGHDFDLGIVCRPNTDDSMVKDMEVYLAPDGIIKVKIFGVEGGILSKQMTHKSADVLCRSAGFPDGASAPYFEGDSSEFGNHYLWIFRAGCVGDESTFADCPFVTFGKEDTWENNRGFQDSGNHGTKLYCKTEDQRGAVQKPGIPQWLMIWLGIMAAIVFGAAIVTCLWSKRQHIQNLCSGAQEEVAGEDIEMIGRS